MTQNEHYEHSFNIFNQNLILKLYCMTIIQRQILNKEQTVIKYFHWPCFADSSTSQNKVYPLQVIY